MNFATLGLSPFLLRALDGLHWQQPTPVQAGAVAAILAGRDVWASSKTGSGKTAAYLIPLLELLGRERSRSSGTTTVLILVPTRELAAQVADVAGSLTKYGQSPAKICLAVGGVSINPQMMSLRGGADLLVATPGRVLDLIAHNSLRLSQVETLVLDEADRLLSGGFSEEVSKITAMLPMQRQNLLFSATMPARVQQLVQSLLDDPVRVNVDAGRTPSTDSIVQRSISVDSHDRTAVLKHLLSTHDWPQVLVFVESRKRANNLADKLKSAGLAAAPLHGELSQGTRTGTLAALRCQRLRVIVATDVAARGLDIWQLPAVINFDLPRSTADYLHRVGRTGRAGHHGMALSLVSAATEAHFRLIEKRHQLCLEREILTGFEPQEEPIAPRDPQGGIKGQRMSKKDKLRNAAARQAAIDAQT